MIISINIDPKLIKKLKAIAKREKRSLSNMIEVLLQNAVG